MTTEEKYNKAFEEFKKDIIKISHNATAKKYGIADDVVDAMDAVFGNLYSKMTRKIKMKWNVNGTVLKCPLCHKERDVKRLLDIAGFKTIQDGNPWGCQCGFIGDVII